MTSRWSVLAALLSLGTLAGCRVGPDGNLSAARAASLPLAAAPATAAASQAPPSAVAAPRSAAAPKPSPAGPHLELPANVDWQTWEAGLARAKADNKPVMLLLWAHWCPRCRELAPAFGDPELAELSKSMVMIQQDVDERPGWLAEKFDNLYGGYVPRVFFLRPDGTVRSDITSGNPQYPYFYVPQRKDAIKASLTRALNG